MINRPLENLVCIGNWWLLILLLVPALWCGCSMFNFTWRLATAKYNRMPAERRLRLWVKFFVGLSVSIVLIGFVISYILTQCEDIVEFFKFSDKSGYIGDTIGGILNPFIAIAAVIVTGLAFYMQYQANRQVNDQFKLQQFESQFYEMLKLHKDCVGEFDISNRKRNQCVAKGRKAIPVFKAELHFILKLFKDAGGHIDEQSFYHIYYHFFNGDMDGLVKHFRTICPKFVKALMQCKPLPVFFPFRSIFEKTRNLKHAQFLAEYDIQLLESKADFLGHYHRQLYRLIKFVVTQEVQGLLTYAKAMNYLRILQAQLSNEEQIMLFYNWIAGQHKSNFGYKLEDQNNKYFTEYLMIYNIPFDGLFDDPFIKRQLDRLRGIAVEKRQSKLFEWD